MGAGLCNETNPFRPLQCGTLVPHLEHAQMLKGKHMPKSLLPTKHECRNVVQELRKIIPLLALNRTSCSSSKWALRMME